MDVWICGWVTCLKKCHVATSSHCKISFPVRLPFAPGRNGPIAAAPLFCRLRGVPPAAARQVGGGSSGRGQWRRRDQAFVAKRGFAPRRGADSGVLRGFPWVARGRPQNAAGGRAGPHVWQVGDMRDRGWGWLIPSNEYALQKPWYVLVPPRGSPMDHPNYLYRGLRASMALLAPPQNDFNIL